MTQGEQPTTATLALADFLQRIDRDPDLPAEIKTAIQKDFAAEIPSSLKNLNAALLAEIDKK